MHTRSLLFLFAAAAADVPAEAAEPATSVTPKPPLPVAEGEPVPMPVRPAPPPQPPPPSPPSPPVRVVGDQRFSFLVAQAQPVGAGGKASTDAAFVVSRGAIGAQADLGRHLEARALINVFEKHAERTIETSDGASFSLEQYPSGWVARVRDAWLDAKLVESGRLTLRSGVQEHIVGERGTLTSPGRGFYVVDPAFQPIFELGGLLTSRELGVRATASLPEDRAALDLMVSNGTGQSGEANLGKDVSARISGDLVPSVHVYGSVLVGTRGEDSSGRDLITVGGAEFHSDHFKVTGSYVGGSTDDGVGDPVPFVGTEGSAWLGTDLASEGLDRGALVARAGWFDPSAAGAERDGWMLFQGAIQLWLATPKPHKLMVGLGVADLIPQDESLPEERRLTGQTIWTF